MTRIVQYTEFGGPEVLRVVDVPAPVAADDGVVVSVRAAGINPIDGKLRTGARASAPLTKPRRAGIDASGIVASVGKDVTGWSAGDEVIVRGASGTYATEISVASTKLESKPAVWSWEQAAAVGVPVGTAYQGLRSLEVGDGTVLLVHAGSGAVGQAAVQFAVAWGATVIATASESNHERLRALGAIPVVYGAGLVERVRAIATVDVVFDAAGTDDALAASLELVADRSRIGTVVAGGRAAELGIRAWSGGNPVPLTDEEQQLRAEGVAAAARLAEAGRFEVEVGASYPLAEVVEAARAAESGAVRGKIVLIP